MIVSSPISAKNFDSDSEFQTSFDSSFQKIPLHGIPKKGADANGDIFVNADFECLPGFRISNDICVDIDECTDTIVKHNCDTATTTCSNVASTFKCVCLKTFVPKTNSKTECQPIAACYSDEYLSPTTNMVSQMARSAKNNFFMLDFDILSPHMSSTFLLDTFKSSFQCVKFPPLTKPLFATSGCTQISSLCVANGWECIDGYEKSTGTSFFNLFFLPIFFQLLHQIHVLISTSVHWENVVRIQIVLTQMVILNVFATKIIFGNPGQTYP